MHERSMTNAQSGPNVSRPVAVCESDWPLASSLDLTVFFVFHPGAVPGTPGFDEPDNADFVRSQPASV